MVLRRLWRGELPLADAFWNWAVIGGLAVNFASTFGLLVLLTFDRPVAALLVGHAVSLPYNIVAGVGVWRSAARYEGPPRLAGLARLLTAIGLTVLSLT